MNNYTKPTETKRIENITRATVNGRKVKLFDVRELHGSAWVYEGQFSVPAKVANKNILDTYQNYAA